MAHLIQKTWIIKVAGGLFIMLFAACTKDQHYKRQVNGNEKYLKTSPLCMIISPSNMTLPQQNSNYKIPTILHGGEVGKKLDIRPPIQPLALLNSSYSEYSGNSATIHIKNSKINSKLWLQITTVIQSKGYPITSRQDIGQIINTNWISWIRADEDKQYSGRYQIKLVTNDNQTSLQITSLALQQQGNFITNPILIQRYTVTMLNSIVNGLQELNAHHYIP